MSTITRRAFLAGSAALPTLSLAAKPAAVTPVDFTLDGAPLPPREHAALLAKICAESKVEADEYSRGGAVAALEAHFAAELGKEACVFMPSGTLANHLAVRALAGARPRVLVQESSHFYNDSGDCAEQLSRLNLVPLAAGRATFTAAEVELALARADGSRVSVPVGAISIESPVRRLHLAAFDLDEMDRVVALAKARGIGLHLDGARLHVWSAYCGRSPAQLAAPFDTVYVSLWKCFDSGGGAVLAGPKKLLEDMYHVRRMFGGALWNAWPYAAMALHRAKDYPARYADAVRVSEALIAALANDDRFAIERVAGGTSLFRVNVRGDAVAMSAKLAARGVNAPTSDGGFWLKVNASLAGRDPAALAAIFRDALA